MSFHDDLEVGRGGEYEVHDLFFTAGFNIVHVEGRNPGCDLVIPHTKIEVKRDMRAQQTGNVFIETHSHGAESGVNLTESQIYVIMVGNVAYSMSVSVLKGILPRFERKFVPDGQKEGVVIPIRLLGKTIPCAKFNLSESLP